MSTATRTAELERQQRLIAAIFAPQMDLAAYPDVRQDGARREAGLAAYRGNGLAHARNALRAQFPTVLAMLGNDAFDVLSARYWHTCPPRRGNLAWVGEELPAYIATVGSLDAWPWLADCARLDWAIWQLAGAAPPRMTHADLLRLAADDPAGLSLHLAACTAYIPSAWPIVTIHLAHQDEAADWSMVRQAILDGTSQTAWVWRPQGDAAAAARVIALEGATARWIAAVAGGESIVGALDAAGKEFDFATWMQKALAEGWLDSVTPCAPR